jgi:hypothetical protein
MNLTSTRYFVIALALEKGGAVTHFRLRQGVRKPRIKEKH